MVGKKRRRFDRAFKIEAVREALNGEHTQKEVAFLELAKEAAVAEASSP